jgi:hypothetical protein
MNNSIKESEKFLEEVDRFEEEAEKMEGEEIINEKNITKSEISKIIKNQKKGHNVINKVKEFKKVLDNFQFSDVNIELFTKKIKKAEELIGDYSS